MNRSGGFLRFRDGESNPATRLSQALSRLNQLQSFALLDFIFASTFELLLKPKAYSITRDFSQSEWDLLIQRFPNGTTVNGVVAACPAYGAWITLDELPDVPALLEIIHFAIRETDPDHRIEHPNDYPEIGTRISARILGWCEHPKDVRLTQLSSFDPI